MGTRKEKIIARVPSKDSRLRYKCDESRYAFGGSDAIHDLPGPRRARARISRLVRRAVGKIAFRKVVLPNELAAILAFDARAFPNGGDYMGPEGWRSVIAYWMLVDDAKAGCCAFDYNLDYDEAPRRGSLYIASIAIAARWRRRGLGEKFTNWQIEYGRKRKFSNIVTNTRQSNTAMINLYKKLGFKVRCATDYYDDPEEPAVVFDLAL